VAKPNQGGMNMLERYKEIIGKAHDSKKPARAAGLIGAVRYDKELDDYQKLDRIYLILDALKYHNREKMLRDSKSPEELLQDQQQLDRIAEECADINHYDDDQFTDPSCLDVLNDIDREEVNEWIADMLKYCAAMAINMYIEKDFRS
jgi:hypothetical protein